MKNDDLKSCLSDADSEEEVEACFVEEKKEDYKDYTYEEAKRDILNSPFSESLGWKEGEELTESGVEVAIKQSIGLTSWEEVGPDKWSDPDGDRYVEIFEENDYYNIALQEGGVRRSLGTGETHKEAVKKAKKWMEEPDSL